MAWNSETLLGTVKPGLGQGNLASDIETWLGTVKHDWESETWLRTGKLGLGQ